MSRKIMVLTMALAIVAVVAFAVTSVAYAAGPQSTADSGNPWVADAGHGEPGDGECDGGDENQYGRDSEGSGWGVPCDGTCDGGDQNMWGKLANGMGAERQLRAVTSIAYADGPQSTADSGNPWVADAGHGEPGDGECDGGDENQYGRDSEGSGWGVPCDGTCDGGDQNMWGKLVNGMGTERQLRMGQ